MLKYFGFIFLAASSVYCMDGCVKLNQSLIPPVELEALQGTWYKLASAPFRDPKLPCDRITTIYDPLNDTLINVGYHYEKKGSPMFLRFSQSIAHKPGGGYFVETKLPKGVENPYYEILTDYTYYTMVYTCTYVDGKYDQTTIWINGKTPKFDEYVFKRALKKLADLGVPPQKWSIGNGKDC